MRSLGFKSNRSSRTRSESHVTRNPTSDVIKKQGESVNQSFKLGFCVCVCGGNYVMAFQIFTRY